MTSPTSNPAAAGAPVLAAGAPRVYLDPRVLLAQPGLEPVDESAIASDAREPLMTLAETGHEIVLVTSRHLDLPPDFPAVREEEGLDGARDAWFLTADPEHCGRRGPGLKSILVGPGPSTRLAEIHRCDIRTRDLHAAVIEILSREAM